MSAVCWALDRMRTACSLGGTGTDDAVDLGLQGAHLVAQLGLLGVEPAELLGDPVQHPVHLGLDVAGTHHGGTGEPHVLQVGRA